ncbi:hypothetical protein ACWDBO_36985 [Streptomyces mirabilis]|uniref:hypothetical protein n=1 Tax=Streptomyces mirabilis TaxID=68239 RepID=UPI00332B2E8A
MVDAEPLGFQERGAEFIESSQERGLGRLRVSSDARPANAASLLEAIRYLQAVVALGAPHAVPLATAEPLEFEEGRTLFGNSGLKRLPGRLGARGELAGGGGHGSFREV